MRLPIFLDTDPALTMPSPLPPRFCTELDLQLMTTVAGNVFS